MNSRGPIGFIVPLQEALDEPRVGGKARNLARLINAGHPVPAGFVVTQEALAAFLAETDLLPAIDSLRSRLDVRSPMGIRCAGETIAALVGESTIPEGLAGPLADSLNGLGDTPVIVRSSAVGEDSEDASFAGQLDSIGNVAGLALARRALLRVWASQWSPRALSYQLSRQVNLRGMGAIVQRQIASAVSGVLFTRAPGRGRHMLIEYCAGSGDALVSGRENPGRLLVTMDGRESRVEASLEGQPVAESLLTDALIFRLAQAGREIASLFGSPQDIEWTIEGDGTLWILQARPITVSETAPASEARDDVHWSNANVNENFPRPISPLLYSIARVGYYHYFRNLGRAFGISSRRLQAMEHPLRHIIGVHASRMYYNLSSIHGVLRSAPGGELLTSSFNLFVGSGNTSTHAATAHGGRFRVLSQGAELAVIAIKTTWQYLFLTRRVSRFEHTVSQFASQTTPERIRQASREQLLAHFRGFIDIRNHRWKDAALADAAAMVCYALLQRILSRLVPAADQQSLHNNLLKALPDLVSGMPPVKLWELSQFVRADARLHELFRDRKPEEVLQTLRTRDEFQEFNKRLDAFLENWGFRCSGELMLTTPTFQDEPERVVELIQAYLATDATSPATILARQAQERIAETRRLKQLLGMPWLIVGLVLRWTQKAILLRERARLKQALLYTRLRHIALAIGDRLVRADRLERREDIFFLTADEIDALLSGVAMFPDHVRPLVELRQAAQRAHASMTPPDTITLGAGEYLEPADYKPTSGATTVPIARERQPELRGTGACGGRAEARAAVLDDISDAQRLVSGDVLVTRQTDPGWGPVFPLISGLVIERGGMLSHGAIIAREFGIPSVVGVHGATTRIAHGARVHVDGDRGLVRILEEA
jgi:rifampicin phosphotransferase